MNYDEFLEYIKNNLAESYTEIMVAEAIDNLVGVSSDDDEASSDVRIDEYVYHRKRKEAENKYGNCDVVIQKVVKNNGIILDAVSIYQEGEQVSPNIYLRPFYEEYLMGKPLDIIMAEIVFHYRNEKAESNFAPIDFECYENVKDKIVVRTINYERNETMLRNCPYIRYLDLAITFRYVVGEDSYGLATVLISNKEFGYWNIDKEELYRTALFNTMQTYPWCMEPLSRLVFDTFDNRMLEKLSKELAEELKQIQNCELGVNIYILTNRAKAFGANCILYDNVISNFAKVQDTNIYILPSSVHEVMLVPEEDDTDPEFLRELLRQANRSSVGLIDLLSDNIYYFDKNKDEIVIFNE